LDSVRELTPFSPAIRLSLNGLKITIFLIENVMKVMHDFGA